MHRGLLEFTTHCSVFVVMHGERSYPFASIGESRNARETASYNQEQTAPGVNDVPPLLVFDVVHFYRRDLS